MHLPGLAQIKKGIDSLTRADTNRLTDDLAHLLTLREEIFEEFYFADERVKMCEFRGI